MPPLYSIRKDDGLYRDEDAGSAVTLQSADIVLPPRMDARSAYADYRSDERNKSLLHQLGLSCGTAEITFKM